MFVGKDTSTHSGYQALFPLPREPGDEADREKPLNCMSISCTSSLIAAPSCSLGIAEVWINLIRAEKYPHPSDLDLLSFVFVYRYVIHTQFVCVCVCVCVCVKYAHVFKFFV